jgi:spore coat polysaccharide biosynthesis protein SpsF
MENNRKLVTPQEEFWAGCFGTDYISRNDGNELLASNLVFLQTH